MSPSRRHGSSRAAHDSHPADKRPCGPFCRDRRRKTQPRLSAAKGCCILATRCRTPYGEIDLIAASSERLIFVEVKRRRTLDEAAFSLSLAQQKRLLRAADYLIIINDTWRREETRFDLALHDLAGGMRWVSDILRFC
ncbi:YraN family protein [Asaia platycodi]|uniref:YraN family protein n=1 Tax=Asaia platycodi TaxID=610243 RepID=UPI0009DE1736